MKVATNADRLVRQVLAGEIWPPLADRHAYRVGPDGQPFLLPGMGGVTLDVHCGDPATGYASDHLEPGASIRHRDPGANMALQYLTCVGNQVHVVSGPAAGAIGHVIGQHAYVLADFAVAEGPGKSDTAAEGPGKSDTAAEGPGKSDTAAEGPGKSDTAAEGPGKSDTAAEGPGKSDTAADLTTGDAVTVLAVGQGLALPDHRQVVVKNCAPDLLAAMPGGTRPDGRLEVHVAARIPAEAIGAGAGMASEYANTDLMGAYAGLGPDLSLGLEGLRIGDLVALADADHRYGRGYRPDYLTIGVISTGQCMMFGHGPGPSTLLSGPASAFCLVDDVDANLASWLHAEVAP